MEMGGQFHVPACLPPVWTYAVYPSPFRSTTIPLESSSVKSDGDERNSDVTLTFLLM